MVNVPRFIQSARQRNVTLASTPTLVIAFFGFLLWMLPLVFYIAACALTASKTVQGLWYINIACHIGIGVMVDIDAFFFAGQYWPWQTGVIGLASYVTFTLPALIAHYIAENAMTELIITMLALLTACTSNAAMIAILFEFYHKGLDYAVERVHVRQISVSRR